MTFKILLNRAICVICTSVIAVWTIFVSIGIFIAIAVEPNCCSIVTDMVFWFVWGSGVLLYLSGTMFIILDKLDRLW